MTTVLPEGWTTRRPTLDDVPAILALTHASDIAALGEPDYTAEEVREMLTEPHTAMSEDSWVALNAENQIIGWTYPHNPTGGPRDFADIYVWPTHGIPALRPLLTLIMNRMSERAGLLGHDPYEVRAGAIPTEQHYIEALTEAGFVFIKQHARMRMPLSKTPPTPPPPPNGVTLRPLRDNDETDLRDFHTVIERSFKDTDHFNLDFPTWRQQLDNESTKSFDEWLVAESDGRVVGALQSSDAGVDDNEGWIKRLGVLRSHRKRGIGAALLRHVFAVYAAKGRSHAGLGVDLTNPTSAVRLYLSVGMTPFYRSDIYRTYVVARPVF